MTDEPTKQVTSVTPVVSVAEEPAPREPLSEQDMQDWLDIANGHTGAFTARIAEAAAKEKDGKKGGSYFEGGV